MQCRREGDVRMLAQRVAKRERQMRRQFGHQPIGDRLRARSPSGSVFAGGSVVRLAWSCSARAATVRSTPCSPSARPVRSAVRPPAGRNPTQRAASRAVDADERAGAADLFWIESNWTIVEGGERRLDLVAAADPPLREPHPPPRRDSLGGPSPPAGRRVRPALPR